MLDDGIWKLEAGSWKSEFGNLKLCLISNIYLIVSSF